MNLYQLFQDYILYTAVTDAKAAYGCWLSARRWRSSVFSGVIKSVVPKLIHWPMKKCMESYISCTHFFVIKMKPLSQLSLTGHCSSSLLMLLFSVHVGDLVTSPSLFTLFTLPHSHYFFHIIYRHAGTLRHFCKFAVGFYWFYEMYHIYCWCEFPRCSILIILSVHRLLCCTHLGN